MKNVRIVEGHPPPRPEPDRDASNETTLLLGHDRNKSFVTIHGLPDYKSIQNNGRTFSK